VDQTISSRYRPGTLIDGRYEVTRLLGRGGMAEVYLAHDRLLDRPVAVKVLREHLSGDDRLLTRFRREARAAAGLSHRNIVAVHDVGVDEEAPYIVMELVRGRALSDVLTEQGPFSPDRVAEIGEAAARALEMAHQAGIVHRDVKPGNVMLTEDGDVKLLDFGIANAVRWTRITDTPAVQGTAEYMAPEQIRGEPADRRSDIYALGVVLYELATGRPPFAGDTPLAIAYRHLEEAPPPPQAVRPDLPDGLSSILLRCLAKQPGDRYGRAEDLASDLRRFRAGEPPSTAPIPARPTLPLDVAAYDLPERPRRWGRVALVLGVILALLATGLVVPLFRGDPVPAGPKHRPLWPPANLAAEGECNGFFDADVVLHWSPSRSRFADGYRVYRSTASGGPYERIGVIGDWTTTSFVDDAVAQDGRYYYVVRATEGSRVSKPSGQAQAETPLACIF
jgi:tRNA A-37 threonylcarbamoyl transferase component Bud32